MDNENPTPSQPEGSPDDTPTPAQRRGTARERQRRREQMRETGQMAVPRSLRAPQLRPVTPAGAFKMPDIKLPKARMPFYIAGAVAIVLGVLYLLAQITGGSQGVQTPPNAIWLGTEWTYALEDGAVEDLVTRLRENEIGTVYAWVSWLKPDMTWGGRRDLTNTFGEVEETVKSFVQQFKQLYPEANLLGWVSLPVGGEPNGRDMADAAVQQAVADFSQSAVTNLGFDGVFLNIEPVWNNDQSFIALLTTVREGMGEDAFIAVAVPPDWSPIGAEIPVPPLIVPGTIWDERYKRSVALLVDEIAVMAYNSGLNTDSGFSPADYSQWLAYQVDAYASAVAGLDVGAGAGVQVFIGIPTYDAEPPGHDPLIENVPAALEGVRQGLQLAGDDAAYVRGVAIYAEWVTDETEWAQFRVNWVEG